MQHSLSKQLLCRLRLVIIPLLLAWGLLLAWTPAAIAQEESPPAPTIYLTFDDGPSSYTQAVLDVLARYNARATFFVVGRQATARPELIAAIAAAGHGLGIHTYNHPSLVQVSWERFQTEVTATHAALGEHDHGCLRPPYGATNRAVYKFAGDLGYTMVMWTVDPRDWALPGAQAIANAVIKRAHPNAIVALHDGGGNRSQTIAALELLLPALAAQGYSFDALCREGPPGAMAGVTPPGGSPIAASPIPAAQAVPGPQASPSESGAPVPLPANNGILAPTASAVLQGQVAVQGVAAHPEFRKWQVDLLIDGSRESFLAFGESPQPTPGLLFTWDTTPYPNGAHILRLRVVRDGLNYDEYFAPVTIRNP